MNSKIRRPLICYALLTGERRSHEGLVTSHVDSLHDWKQVEKLAFETSIGFVPYGGVAWQASKTVTHDDTSPVRALATGRLARDSQRNTPTALTKYVTDKKPLVCDVVVIAIVHRGDPDLVNAVETLLTDEDDTVRYDAAATVIYLSGPPVKRKANKNA